MEPHILPYVLVPLFLLFLCFDFLLTALIRLIIHDFASSSTIILDIVLGNLIKRCLSNVLTYTSVINPY